MGENSLLADFMNKKYTHKKLYIYTLLETKQSIEIKKYSYLFHQPLSMDWSMSFFRYGTLLYIIEEVKLSIEILVLYKFMLGTFFNRKDSINFLWFTFPIWYTVEKLSIEIAWSVLFLCLTMALFSLLVRKSVLCCCTFSPNYRFHQYTANYMNYMACIFSSNFRFFIAQVLFGRIICTIHKSYIRWNKFTDIFFFTFWW